MRHCCFFQVRILCVILKTVRMQRGMTQEERAEKLHTKKTVIFRIENHSESTL
ncbi:MAG: helix-turn-helix transcriptional regulator [Treponema sp.]|nr:helix-turn-helix transcriptional regulator [Treponema sp.]